MHSRIRRRRLLGLLIDKLPKDAEFGQKSLVATTTPEGIHIPSELTTREYAIFLLHIAAELEHVLMVQYLYAAYSLSGPGISIEHQPDVMRWREIILGIAKEEMGHLMTVQNLLRCLGGPLNFDREDYPWDSEFYPFPFCLQPLSPCSLARYIVAESPADWKGDEADKIRKMAESETTRENQAEESLVLHRIGALYETIEALFASPGALKDSDFRASTYPFQTTWDEFGRGYKKGARGTSAGGAMPQTPSVILLPVTSRTDSLVALRAISIQGEATPTASDEAPSHFARFLQIYREMSKGAWKPRKVAINPIVIPETLKPEDAALWRGTPITHRVTKLWAHLFNVRYRLLLTNLLYTFEYPNNLSERSQVTPRGLLLNGAFGEMYNLRALAEILAQSPLSLEGRTEFAGPPFQMPYTLKLPMDPDDRWMQFLELLTASELLVQKLVPDAGSYRTYLNALLKVDKELRSSIEAILGHRSASISPTQN